MLLLTPCSMNIGTGDVCFTGSNRDRELTLLMDQLSPQRNSHLQRKPIDAVSDVVLCRCQFTAILLSFIVTYDPLV